MVTIRKADERGHVEFGWLDSQHSFSFGHYYDPNHMGFRALRVINEDRVAPGAGFDPHPHRDMEILTYVLEGALRHEDSMGNGSIIRPGDVQRMTAGTGVVHSEYNASDDEPVHLLQIWILPGETGLQPSYEQKTFPPAERQGRLRLVASPDGRDGSVTIHRDAFLYAGRLAAGESASHAPEPGRHLWLQVARGVVTLEGQTFEEKTVNAGDGVSVSDVSEVTVRASEDAEVLLFDLD